MDNACSPSHGLQAFLCRMRCTRAVRCDELLEGSTPMHSTLTTFCKIPGVRLHAFPAFVLLAVLFVMTAFPGTAPDVGRTRRTENFCGGWRFHLGDVQNGQVPSFDDSGW